MTGKLIEWDGSEVPAGLRDLPPGVYVVEPFAGAEPLTKEEENGILEALDDYERGGGIPLEEVVREFRGRNDP